MKYAIQTILDQTNGYWDGEDWTTKIAEVLLFDSLEAAQAALPACKATWKDRQDDNSYYIEAIVDETEFRAQKDTW